MLRSPRYAPSTFRNFKRSRQLRPNESLTVSSAVLGYVFWHAPRNASESVAYAAALLDFHVALAAAPPAGFVRSFSTRTSRVPWLDADSAYEDWYVVADSAALDPLDRAAVDVRRRGAHDAAASAARVGIGGLYRLVHGEPIVPIETAWFAKPLGVGYADFAPTLETAKRRGATLWQRQMVLGPAPEYALQKRIEIETLCDVRTDHTELAR